MKPTTRTFSECCRLLALGLVLLGLGGCSSLLFYPERGQAFTPERAKLAYRDVTLNTADGLRLHGWWLPAKAGVDVKGTVLHLHGNGGNLPVRMRTEWPLGTPLRTSHIAFHTAQKQNPASMMRGFSILLSSRCQIT